MTEGSETRAHGARRINSELIMLAGLPPIEVRQELRGLIGEIQAIARKEHTGGRRSPEQEEALQNFLDSVDREIDTFGTEKGDFLTILPYAREAVKRMAKAALKPHMIGFMHLRGRSLPFGVRTAGGTDWPS